MCIIVVYFCYYGWIDSFWSIIVILFFFWIVFFGIFGFCFLVDWVGVKWVDIVWNFVWNCLWVMELEGVLLYVFFCEFVVGNGWVENCLDF